MTKSNKNIEYIPIIMVLSKSYDYITTIPLEVTNYQDCYYQDIINLMVEVNHFDNEEKAKEYLDNNILNNKEKYTNIYLAFIDQKLAGMCMLWEGYHFGEKRYRIHWLSVSLNHQKKGIAKSILSKIIEDFNGRNYDYPLYLVTSLQNIEAIRLYLKCNFEVYTKDLKDYSGEKAQNEMSKII